MFDIGCWLTIWPTLSTWISIDVPPTISTSTKRSTVPELKAKLSGSSHYLEWAAGLWIHLAVHNDPRRCDSKCTDSYCLVICRYSVLFLKDDRAEEDSLLGVAGRVFFFFFFFLRAAFSNLGFLTS